MLLHSTVLGPDEPAISHGGRSSFIPCLTLLASRFEKSAAEYRPSPQNPPAFRNDGGYENGEPGKDLQGQGLDYDMSGRGSLLHLSAPWGPPRRPVWDEHTTALKHVRKPRPHAVCTRERLSRDYEEI